MQQKKLKSLNEEKVKLTILDPKDKSHQNKVIVDIVKEIINVNGMKVYSYNGKTYTFRDKSNRCFERTLR